MANTIILKNGTRTSESNPLTIAEPGFDTNSKVLYIGVEGGLVQINPIFSTEEPNLPIEGALWINTSNLLKPKMQCYISGAWIDIAGTEISAESKLNEGTEIGTITIEGNTTTFYAPNDEATQTKSGLMSATDKTKIDNIYVQSTEPENAIVGAIWIDTTE